MPGTHTTAVPTCEPVRALPPVPGQYTLSVCELSGRFLAQYSRAEKRENKHPTRVKLLQLRASGGERRLKDTTDSEK